MGASAIMVKPKQAKSADLVPDGVYSATLVEVKQFTNAFGYRLGFLFEVVGGEHGGSQIMRSTSAELTAKGLLNQIISGIIGRGLSIPELTNGFDVSALVGQSCKILVRQVQSKNGMTYSNIEQVFQS